MAGPQHPARKIFVACAVVGLLAPGAMAALWGAGWLSLYALSLPLVAVGTLDMVQTRHTIRRNFPLIGHGRYLMEAIRPELNQYFIESNWDGRPYHREARSIVYQRAKAQLDTRPFGTQQDVYGVGYEWMDHSMVPADLHAEPPRIRIGGPDCTQPYDASLLNISAMSFGSLSNRAVLALNGGAARGGFFHNTGEGSISDHHLAPGGDLCWQIGTGYFGCRRPDGGFDVDRFEERARLPNVKLIEVKLSQGAKPGHGGILPAAKITPEIASIRGVPLGQDVISPPAHTAFDGPAGLLRFVALLRERSGGKPVGFKLCVGKRREFLAICKAMVSTGITPDFITVDGGEGGTGAAPLEFTDHVGAPLIDGLVFVHNALIGFALRDRIKLIASGKVTMGFDIAKRLALGADLCTSARAMMMAVGCIQALRCNSNHCPAGVATQDPELIRGLDVADKTERVYRYHHNTVESFMELLGAGGLHHPDQLRPWHIKRRVDLTEVRHYAELYDWLEPGSLRTDDEDALPREWRRAMKMASAETFAAAA